MVLSTHGSWVIFSQVAFAHFAQPTEVSPSLWDRGVRFSWTHWSACFVDDIWIRWALFIKSTVDTCEIVCTETQSPFGALECLLSTLGLGCPGFFVRRKTFLVLLRSIAALLHSAPPKVASLRGASLKKLFVAIVKGGTATLKHMDGFHTVLHFFLNSFTK